MDAKFLQYCIKSGIFTQDLLRRVVSTMDENVSIYDSLIRKGLVNQEQLAITAGNFYNCPVVDLSRVTPESQATSYGSGSVCRRHFFIPFAVDPVVGVLVAIADYSYSEAVTNYLKEASVDRIKYYIAPFHTLMQMVDKVYGPESQAMPAVSGKMRRSSSILRTQCVDFDIASLQKSSQSSSSEDPRIQKLTQELAESREEVAALRQRLEQLAATIELETAMTRELVKILKTQGILSAEGFERWLTSQR